MFPRQSRTTHTEQLGNEASVYDWARKHVHALNPTAARVWQLCDGATSPEAIAATLRQETGIAEADAIVDLTLKQLARVDLLEAPVEPPVDRPAPTRRWLIERGLAAAMLPAVYTILAPTPVEAQSPGGLAPTLISVVPNAGVQGTTVAVTLAGTNFVIGATTVNVSGAGVAVNNVVVSSTTSLTANFVLDPAAATGGRSVTVTTAGGTSNAQTFTVNPPAGPAAPTLISVVPNAGVQGTTAAVTLTGTNFVIGATTVNVTGTGLAVNSVVVSSTTSLTANFVLDPAATLGARTVTVTTAGGTSNGLAFTVNPPAGPAAPTLVSVVPNQGTQGTTVAVTLTGTNFVIGATEVLLTGVGVTVNTVVVGSTTSLTANFVLDPAAETGARTVTVRTTGGTSNGLAFTVNPPAGPAAPTLVSVVPPQGTVGTTVPVTLTGTNFIVGATTVNVSGGGVTVNTVVVGSTTSLTANFVLTATGPQSVTVTTAGGTSNALTFTVNPPAQPAPTLVSVAPPQGTVGTTVPVTLTGTNFIVGATTVNLGGTGVTATNVVVSSTTSLTANFGIAAGTALGGRSVTVTTAGGTSNALTFTVIPPE